MKKLITTCALLTSVSMVSFAQSKQVNTSASMQADPNKTTAVKQKQAPATAVKEGPVAARHQAFEQKAEKAAKAYQQEYKLTAEQTAHIYEAEKNYAIQEDELKRNNVPADAGPYMQMNMQREHMIKVVLTPDQLSKYESKHKPQATKNN